MDRGSKGQHGIATYTDTVCPRESRLCVIKQVHCKNNMHISDVMLVVHKRHVLRYRLQSILRCTFIGSLTGGGFKTSRVGYQQTMV